MRQRWFDACCLQAPQLRGLAIEGAHGMMMITRVMHAIGGIIKNA